jgi:hypothetical protein
LRHSSASLAALDAHGDELGGALAVAHDGLRQQARDFQHRRLERAAVGAVQRRDRRVPAWLVAITMKESLVDVSPSTVARLNEPSASSKASCGSSGCAIAGVGGQEAEHGRHVGPDHAGALADAGDGDGRRRRPAPAG